ncbi:hypothetical protein NUACC26_057940 [Scytonema sp. NUACC26]
MFVKFNIPLNPRHLLYGFDLKLTSHEALHGCEKEISISSWETCDECHGSGRDNRDDMCIVCVGEGRNQVVKKLKVVIPANVASGDILKIAGAGDAGGQGGDTGDLYIHLLS